MGEVRGSIPRESITFAVSVRRIVFLDLEWGVSPAASGLICQGSNRPYDLDRLSIGERPYPKRVTPDSLLRQPAIPHEARTARNAAGEGFKMFSTT